MVPTQSETASKGVAVAVVTDNKDPDGLCRVKVRYPWLDAADNAYWARLAMPMAGKDRGLVLIPEVGDEVVVAFERGDIHVPCVLGALWNGKAKPPLANSDGKNERRMLKSRKGHMLLFNDGSRGAVEVAHVDGRRVVLDDDGIRIEDAVGNGISIESTSGAMSIRATGVLTIKAETISIEATGTLDLKAAGSLTVRGSQISIN